LRTDWPVMMDAIRTTISPAHNALFAHYPMPYYWSVDESEWATDIMFRDPDQLAQLYPRLLAHAVSVFKCHDIMRFLGRLNPQQQRINPRFNGDVVTTLKQRPEGVRIKHSVNWNSIKMYDKEGLVLRTETTINNTRDFKVLRRADDNPQKPYRWHKMRKGVADLHRRAQISQASNSRYLEALSVVESTATVEEQLKPICRKVFSDGKCFRALNPWSDNDAILLETISRGEFSINGFRNRNIVAAMYPHAPSLPLHARKRLTAKVSRHLRLLRAHGIIKKVAKTHRYLLTDTGKHITTSCSLLNDTKLKDLYKNAA
jgi:hypothetical protein